MEDNKKSAFTLIELSIVLIIIGMIVGGVLVGKQLIEAASLQSVMKDVESITTSTLAFRMKYDDVPGDMPDAYDFFGADCGSDTDNLASSCNGTGNGLVLWNDVASRSESVRFFYHMYLANLNSLTKYSPTLALISASTPLYPGSRFNAAEYFFNYIPSLGHHYLYVKNSSIPSGTRAIFTPEEAFILDTKFDDGQPYLGVIRGTPGDNPEFSGGECIVSSAYDLTSDAVECFSQFKIKL